MRDMPTMNTDVSRLFENYPDATREKLLLLRQMIFDTAQKTEGVGELKETLKWGQISYLTPVTKSGSTIRIDEVKDNAEQVALFFNCQTTLVETFRMLYRDQLEFEGNRCVRFNVDDAVSVEMAEDCIALALTYHLSKKRQK